MHAFHPSALNKEQCNQCKRPEIDHTDRATCEVCSNSGNMVLYVDILMCQECHTKEILAMANIEKTADKRVAEMNDARMLNSLARAIEIDSSIQLRTDIFNAQTMAIVDVKNAIDADETIENKNYKLAEFVTNRLNHLKGVIFELDEKRVAVNNEQKAIQVYLNQLVNKLSTEERDKLKLQDIEYKPSEVKIKKPAAPKVKKFDKTEIRRFALELSTELGFPVADSLLQSICVAKNLTAEQAANSFRKSVKETDSMQ